MTAHLARPHVLDPHGGVDPCATCEVRAITVCNAIADADLARLATIAVVTEVPAGQCFIDEGEPANCFFIVTAGTAKLFKLLPDGRRQIIGFVGPGQFLGLAVSDTYAFSAEAIEPVRYCRFQRAALRALLDDFPLMEKRLLEVASDELVAAQEQMLLLGRKTARERLASFLLTQSRQGLPCGHSRQRFKLPMTRSRHRRLYRTDDRDGQPHVHEAARRGADRHRVAERDGDLRPVRAGGAGGRHGLLRRLRTSHAQPPAAARSPPAYESNFTRRYGDRVRQSVC